MSVRGLHDTRGELFAYLRGQTLYTLDGEATGRLQEGFVVDTAGNKIWRVHGDGVYAVEDGRSVGYFSSPTPEDI